jgi:hypothetical protein
MAGAGAKKFPAFSKLASDDVNNYLADQVIMRFATTTARDAAFGGVGEPTLAEGMTAYIDADNTIYTYDGSNWIKMVSASQPPAMQLISSVSFVNQTQVDFPDVFSSSFQTYRIEFDNLTATAGDDFFMRFRSSAGIISTTDYLTLRNEVTDASNTAFYAGAGYSTALRPTYIEAGAANMRSTGYMEVFNANLPDFTTTSSTYSRIGNQVYVVNATGYFRLTTVLTGFSFVRGGSGTISGRATVYGYRQ